MCICWCTLHIFRVFVFCLFVTKVCKWNSYILKRNSSYKIVCLFITIWRFTYGSLIRQFLKEMLSYLTWNIQSKKFIYNPPPPPLHYKVSIRKSQECVAILVLWTAHVLYIRLFQARWALQAVWELLVFIILL